MVTLVLPDLPMTAEDLATMAYTPGLRVELDGGLLEVASAVQMAWHSRAALRLADLPERDGRSAISGVGVVLGPRTVPIPDVVRFRSGQRPDPFASQFPAAMVDLVVEIVSPESRVRDQEINPGQYRSAGIPEMWIVTPHERPDGSVDGLITVHRFGLDFGSDLARVTHLLADLEG